MITFIEFNITIIQQIIIKSTSIMRICHIFLKRILNFKATAINIIVEMITITHLWFIENSYFPATLSPVNAELISAKENSFPLNSYTKKFTKPNNRSTQWEIIQVISS